MNANPYTTANPYKKPQPPTFPPPPIPDPRTLPPAIPIAEPPVMQAKLPKTKNKK